MILKTRGDTIQLEWQRIDTDGNVITTAPSEMWLTVSPDWDSPVVLIQKSLTQMTMDEEGFWHVTIQGSETEPLPYGTYVFDIEVTAQGITTTICKDQLVLTEESTWSTKKA